MKISVFYEHIQKACEQTKKPLEEVLAHVKKSGIEGVEMDYDVLSSEDNEQSILTSLKKAGLVISSIYGFCHLDIDPEEQKCLDVIDQAAKNGCSRVLIVPGFFSEADAKKTALDRVSGATDRDIYEWKLDYDDGRPEYEGKIIYGGTEYEFTIDAATGSVMEWDAEKVR